MWQNKEGRRRGQKRQVQWKIEKTKRRECEIKNKKWINELILICESCQTPTRTHIARFHHRLKSTLNWLSHGMVVTRDHEIITRMWIADTLSLSWVVVLSTAIVTRCQQMEHADELLPVRGDFILKLSRFPLLLLLSFYAFTKISMCLCVCHVSCVIWCHTIQFPVA